MTVWSLFSERADLKAAICTYHKPDDAKDFQQFFNDLNYRTSFTGGYVFMAEPNPLRRGVIRAQRQSINMQLNPFPLYSNGKTALDLPAARILTQCP